MDWCTEQRRKDRNWKKIGETYSRQTSKHHHGLEQRVGLWAQVSSQPAE